MTIIMLKLNEHGLSRSWFVSTASGRASLSCGEQRHYGSDVINNYPGNVVVISIVTSFTMVLYYVVSVVTGETKDHLKSRQLIGLDYRSQCQLTNQNSGYE